MRKLFAMCRTTEAVRGIRMESFCLRPIQATDFSALAVLEELRPELLLWISQRKNLRIVSRIFCLMENTLFSLSELTKGNQESISARSTRSKRHFYCLLIGREYFP